DATTLMEHLIMQGVPQRTAHEIIGRLVGTAMKRGVPLAALSIDEFQAAHPALDKQVFAVLGAERAVNAITSYGSTNPEQVAHQLNLWRERLEQNS
ncbi:MAG: argininosuccinate lyase, partial [Pirellulales bacterium]